MHTLHSGLWWFCLGFVICFCVCCLSAGRVCDRGCGFSLQQTRFTCFRSAHQADSKSLVFIFSQFFVSFLSDLFSKRCLCCQFCKCFTFCSSFFVLTFFLCSQMIPNPELYHLQCLSFVFSRHLIFRNLFSPHQWLFYEPASPLPPLPALLLFCIINSFYISLYMRQSLLWGPKKNQKRD